MGSCISRRSLNYWLVAAILVFLESLAAAGTPVAILRHASGVLNPVPNTTAILDIDEWEDGKPSRADVYEASFLGQDNLLLRKIKPAADRGRTILVVRNALWIEIPTARRPLHLTTEQRWSSDAAFADLARANFSRDYKIEKLQEDPAQKGLLHFTLRALNQDVPYANVELWVDQKTWRPIRAQFTTASSVFIRRCEYLSYESAAGMLRPTRFAFSDPIRPGWKAEVVFKQWTTAQVSGKSFDPAALGKEESVIMAPSQAPVALKQARINLQPLSDMVSVPSGAFVMGRDNGFPDEQPAHPVNVGAFLIDRTEATVEQYKRFLRATGKDAPPAPVSPSMPKDYFTNPRYRLFPMVNVSWEDANSYCLWLKKRLPTENEWEKAARSTDQRLYPWGNIWDDEKVNGRDTPFSSLPGKTIHFTVEIGKYSDNASPYGTLDMVGNVAEWVQDWYAAYPGSLNVNDAYGRKYKVLRGGSWVNSSLALSAVGRDFADPKHGFESVGFRCAKSN